MRKWTFFPVAFAFLLCVKIGTSAKSEDQRDGRLFPLFQIVKFKNELCTSTSKSLNGTCYTRFAILSNSL